MYGFQKIASTKSNSRHTFVGSIAGNVVFSVNPRHPVQTEPEAKSKKRSRDTCAEEAERAVERVRRSGADAATVSRASFKAAEASVESMLRLRGARGERVIESWAVSMRKSGQWGSSVASGARPNIVVAFRLVGGVAIPLGSVCSALRVCRDGIITTESEKVAKEFDLPLSDQAVVAQESGQISVLVLAGVPHLED
jgi:hypothetical protein